MNTGEGDSPLSTTADVITSFRIALTAEGLAAKTISTHLEGLDLFFRKYPVRLEDVTPDHIRMYLANPRWGQWTKRLRWKALSAFFRFCVGDGHIGVSPVELVPCPKPGKARKPPKYEPVDIDALLEACDTTGVTGAAKWLGLRDQALVLLLGTTPARASEICGVLVTDVDFAAMKIRYRGKGGVVYESILFPQTARALDRYLKCRPFDMAPLFVTRDARMLTTAALRLVLKRLKAKAGITKPIYPHAFRHNFGMQTIEWGLAIDEAAKAMGHRSTKATEIYRQWVTEDAALAKIRHISQRSA